MEDAIAWVMMHKRVMVAAPIAIIGIVLQNVWVIALGVILMGGMWSIFVFRVAIREIWFVVRIVGGPFLRAIFKDIV